MMLVSAIRGVVLPVLVLAAVVSQALGQTNPVDPYYAVTTRAQTPLKSGDMDGYYPVALLDAGQVLWIDAEGAGWARAAYPPGLSVYVLAEEVREEAGGAAVVLTKKTGLKSRNLTGGFGASWQRAAPLHSEPAAGTRLRVIQAIKDPDGNTIGYEVEPPPSARGYVKAEALRAATDAEVQAYLATVPEPAADEPEAVEPEPAAGVDDNGAGEGAGEEPGADDAVGDDGNLLEPMTPPGDDDAAGDDEPTADEPAADEPEVEQPADDQPAGDEPAGDDSVVEIKQAESPESRLIGTLRQLAELFAEVQSQDSDTAELDELAAEFRRAIAAQGDDVIGRRIRDSLGQRLALVEMRIEARDVRRELRARREAIDATYSSVAGRVRELERTRGYQFVGRLVRSSVYDGDRLPLMYRMVSVNESVPRTIGYIVPDSSLDVTGKLGEIVGVLGTSTLDEALNLRIVTPVRVDILTPEGLGLPAESAAPAGALAEQPGS